MWWKSIVHSGFHELFQKLVLYTRPEIFYAASKEESGICFGSFVPRESSFLFGFAAGDKVQMPEHILFHGYAASKARAFSRAGNLRGGSEIVATFGGRESRQRFVIVQADKRDDDDTLARKYLPSIIPTDICQILDLFYFIQRFCSRNM